MNAESQRFYDEYVYEIAKIAPERDIETNTHFNNAVLRIMQKYIEGTACSVFTKRQIKNVNETNLRNVLQEMYDLFNRVDRFGKCKEKVENVRCALVAFANRLTKDSVNLIETLSQKYSFNWVKFAELLMQDGFNFEKSDEGVAFMGFAEEAESKILGNDNSFER